MKLHIEWTRSVQVVVLLFLISLPAPVGELSGKFLSIRKRPLL